VCEICAELLRIPAASPDDNFFALGGDSILALRLVSRAREQGLDITARDVMLSTTLAEVARAAQHVPLAASELRRRRLQRVAELRRRVEQDAPLDPDAVLTLLLEMQADLTR
jgi:aryl carrier-like protein